MLGLFTTKAYAEPASETPAAAPQAAPRSSRPRTSSRARTTTRPRSRSSTPSRRTSCSPRRSTTCAARSSRCSALGRATACACSAAAHADGRSASLIVDAAARRATTRRVLRRACASSSRTRFGRAARRRRTRSSARATASQMHFTVHAPERRPARSVAARARARGRRDVARTWDDRAREALVARHGERGRVARRALGASACRTSYKAAVDPTAAARGHRRFERLSTSGEPVRRRAAATRATCTRESALYRAAARSSSRAAMPMLEHLGLRVIEERPTRLVDGDGGDVGAGLRRPRARPTARSTSTRPATASPTASRPSGAARRSRTRSTAS